MPEIKDSGQRREFDTGAVRDIQEGKGRCDLMPLDVVGEFMENVVIILIGAFQETGEEWNLLRALNEFRSSHYDTDATMMLEVSKHFEAGALKYGENNWKKGLPVSCYLDSAVRHYLKFIRGDDDEPHGRAFVWNILCALWTADHYPELNTFPKKGSKSLGIRT